MAVSTLINDPAALVPGWYCVGFSDESGEINWGAAPIYHYLGNGEWADESGRPVDSFFDPFLQLDVSTGAADAYLPQ